MDSQPLGYNPVRWSCEKNGCFNKLRRPKIEVFAGCFPRRVNFGDVDGLVELGGSFCLLEWKGEGGSIKVGQQISLSRFTLIPGNFVLAIEGNAETMEVRRLSRFWGGKQRPWEVADLERVKHELQEWASFAEAGKEER